MPPKQRKNKKVMDRIADRAKWLDIIKQKWPYLSDFYRNNFITSLKMTDTEIKALDVYTNEKVKELKLLLDESDDKFDNKSNDKSNNKTVIPEKSKDPFLEIYQSSFIICLEFYEKNVQTQYFIDLAVIVNLFVICKGTCQLIKEYVGQSWSYIDHSVCDPVTFHDLCKMSRQTILPDDVSKESKNVLKDLNVYGSVSYHNIDCFGANVNSKWFRKIQLDIFCSKYSGKDFRFVFGSKYDIYG